MTIGEAHEADVNVIGWNRKDAHLLASGGDDGVIKVFSAVHAAVCLLLACGCCWALCLRRRRPWFWCAWCWLLLFLCWFCWFCWLVGCCCCCCFRRQLALKCTHVLGCKQVWDLRQVAPRKASLDAPSVDPSTCIAVFTFHRGPITSLVSLRAICAMLLRSHMLGFVCRMISFVPRRLPAWRK